MNLQNSCNNLSAISIQNVSKRYPGVKALDDVSFCVKKGEIHGFLGPNGAGKSTTMKIISGLLPSSEGDVFIFGKNIKDNIIHSRSKIGFLPENPPLYLNMTVNSYLKFVAQIHGVSGKDVAQATRDIVIKCGLGEVQKRLIGNLSKGFRQRVGIAQALIFMPEIVILDEPTVGLDPNAIVEIRSLITSLKEDHTILLSTHQLHEANNLCTNITIINEGRIIQTGPVLDIQKQYQDRQYILIELSGFSEDFKEKLCNNYTLESITRLEGDRTLIKISCESSLECKANLSRMIVESGHGLLAMREEKLTLEEIFKRATR